MAVSVKADPKAETELFVVLVVSAACDDGTALPDKRVTVSKSALAEGVLTLTGERDRQIAAAQQRIRNFEATQAALRELN